MEAKKSKWHISFPSAFTILFTISILAILATWLVPAGAYSKLSYNEAEKSLLIHQPDGSDKSLPATQASLDQLKIKINITQFTEGTIRKAIAVPDTYQRLPQNRESLLDVPHAMVRGTIEAVDVIVFILVLGGLIGVINKTGAFNAGLIALSKKTKGHEFLLVFSVAVAMLIGGTTCGIEEEAVAFYPILVPIFLALGYDSIVCVGAIFLASSMGTTFSTINPFSVVIASSAAGIPFTEGIIWRLIGLIVSSIVLISYLYWYAKKVKNTPSFSYTYEDKEHFEHLYSTKDGNDENNQFTLRKKLILILFTIGFPIMIWGVASQGWWFPTMAASFLSIAIIIMFISGMKEKDIVDAFIKGAGSLVGVSLIIGLARGVNLILDEGQISDTLLFYASHAVAGLNGIVFVIALLFIFFLLGFIVPSSSGLAVLSMPIMAPLADTIGLPRDIVVSAYNWGQYAMLYLAPTGLVLATLQMLDMKYSHWLKFVLPMVIYCLIFSSILLSIQVLVA